jgi:SecD/SecF fusion protein
MRLSGLVCSGVVVMLVSGCGAQQDEIRMTYRVSTPDGVASATVTDEVVDVLRDRLAAARVDAAKVVADGREIVVSASGDEDATRATITALTAPGSVAIYDWENTVVGPDGRPAPGDPKVTGGAAADTSPTAISRRAAQLRGGRVAGGPRGRVIVRASATTAGGWFVLVAKPAMTGADIEHAKPVHDQAAGEPSVAMTFTPRGQESFAELTRELAERGARAIRAGTPVIEANQHFAIVVDDRIVATPYIDPRQNPEGIDGSFGGLISGGMTAQQAARLAGLISAGPLPARLAP